MDACLATVLKGDSDADGLKRLKVLSQIGIDLAGDEMSWLALVRALRTAPQKGSTKKARDGEREAAIKTL